MSNWTKSELIVLPIALLIMVAISCFLGYLLQDKDEKIKNIPFQVIASVLLALEVIKQVLHLVNHTYTTWQIPLHFCSTFLIWLPLAAFAKGKTQRVGKIMSFCCGCLLLVSFYVSPRGIIGNSCSNLFEDFDTFHTFTYHHLVLLYLFLMFALHIYIPRKDDLKYYIVAYACYAITATIFGHLLNTNYCNILYSTIPILESVRLKAGQLVYTLLLAFLGLAGGLAFDYVYLVLCNKIERKKIASKQKAKNSQQIAVDDEEYKTKNV